jgi:hypothetical protein
MAFDVSKIPFKTEETKVEILKEFEQAHERGREKNFILAAGTKQNTGSTIAFVSDKRDIKG